MPTHRRASPPHTGDANQPKARPRGPWLIEAVSETLAWPPPNTQTLSQNELLSICFLISKGRTTTWINATTPGCQRHHSGDRGADRGGGGSTCPTQAPGGRHPQSWAHWEEAADLGPTASTWASFSLGTSPLPANGPPSSEATKQAPSTDTGNAHSSWSALRLEKDKHSHHPVHCPATCGGGGGFPGRPGSFQAQPGLKRAGCAPQNTHKAHAGVSGFLAPLEITYLTSRKLQ